MPAVPQDCQLQEERPVDRPKVLIETLATTGLTARSGVDQFFGSVDAGVSRCGPDTGSGNTLARSMTDTMPAGDETEVPYSALARRLQRLPKINLQKFLMLVGTGLGLWLLVEQFVGLSDFKGAFSDVTWAWVLVVLLVTQATSFTEAVAMSGAVQTPLPIARLTLLRFAMGIHRLDRWHRRHDGDRRPLFQDARIGPRRGSQLGPFVQPLGLRGADRSDSGPAPDRQRPVPPHIGRRVGVRA